LPKRKDSSYYRAKILNYLWHGKRIIFWILRALPITTGTMKVQSPIWTNRTTYHHGADQLIIWHISDTPSPLYRVDEDLIHHMHRAILKSQDQAVRGTYTECVPTERRPLRRNPEFDPVYMVRINETACNPGFDIVKDENHELVVLRTITYQKGNRIAEKEALRIARTEVIKLENKHKQNSKAYKAKRAAVQLRTQRRAA
jgi:hypothetical protein